MNMIWVLFWTFFKIGLVSFGGGYAMLPVLEREVLVSHHWMSTEAFSDTIALAGMSPGPIAVNAAVFIGYEQAGWFGAVVTTTSIILPSLLIMILLGGWLSKYQYNQWFQSAFYGLKPVVTGLIFYAAIRLSTSDTDIISVHTVILFALVLLALMGLIRYKLHPLLVLVGCGIAGMAFFG